MFRLFFSAVLFAVAFSAPAIAQEREWSLGAAGDDVFMAFGVPETPDIGVSFWCRIGSKAVSVFTPLPMLKGPDKKALQLSLGVNDRNYVLSAKVGGDGGSTLEAVLKPQAELLAALMATDRFSLTIGKHKTTFPLNGADFAGLLAMCANKDGGVTE